ncbi:MAG: AraC family transcriptional regulator [Clostridiales bacterium]|nr:AraC family transcriptional regulator [Clostridiales bacterium]
MYINTFKETIIYEKITRTNPYIDVFLAGITNANPEYYISRKKWLRDFYVFEYVLSGKGYIRNNDDVYPVNAGDFYFLGKAANVQYYADKNDPYKKLFINIGGSIIDSMISAFKLEDITIRHTDVLYTFKELHTIIEKLDIEQDPMLLRAVSRLIYELINSVADQDLIFGNANKISNAAKIHDYIDNHLTRHVTLSDISDKFFLSETHCIRIFRDKYGVTPIKYMMEARLKKSREIVTSTDLPIQDIAAMFQFCDAQHYSKAFKQQFGISPAQYRLSANKDK